jgi:hypothetical protein
VDVHPPREGAAPREIDGHTNAVAELLDAAEERCASEGNWSGLVDIRTVRLTARRQQADIYGYVRAAAALADEHRRDPMRVFAAQAVLVELAQMLVYHIDA